MKFDVNRPIAPDPYDLTPEVPSFTVISDEFEDGDQLPRMLTGLEGNLSPSLRWSGYPEETRSFLVTCFDPDAPLPGGFWHWLAADVDATVTGFQPGAGAGDDSLPGDAFHLANTAGGHCYTGAMPPVGDRSHRYIFAVHALDVEDLGLTADTPAPEAAKKAVDHTIARGVITGTFVRPEPLI